MDLHFRHSALRNSLFISIASLIASIPGSAWAVCVTTNKSAVRDVMTFAGADIGQKITNAMNDLICNGITAGVLDARSMTGVQTISQELRIGNNWDNSFTLQLGRVTIETT